MLGLELYRFCIRWYRLTMGLDYMKGTNIEELGMLSVVYIYMNQSYFYL